MPNSIENLRQVERLFQILFLVQTRRSHAVLGRSELASACHCDSRTIQRDINLLRRAAIDICYDPSEKAYVLPEKGLPYFAPPLTLTDTFALAFARATLTAPGTPFREVTASALTKVSAGIRAPLRRLLDEAASTVAEPTTPRDYAGAPVQLLLQACAERRTIEMDYTSYSGRGRSWRRVDPYSVEARESVFWEMHGWCHMNQAMRTFALDRRLHNARLTGGVFLRNEAAWGVFQRDKGIGGLRGGGSSTGSPIRVEVHFSAEAAPYALIRNWPAGLAISETSANGDDGAAGNGALLIGASESGVDALITELLRWRRHARVVGGPELRERMTVEIQAMTDIYAPVS